MNKMTRILVVDDDPTVLEAFSMILRDAGYEVWETSNGRQGLQLTREKRPDLVLMDVMLPDLSGIEVCRQIKADVTLLDVFVVLVSGKATHSTDKVRGAKIGADDYILKPVNGDEFLARIRTIVRLRDTTAALRASEQYYKQLIEILPDAINMIDLQGVLTAANEQSVKMFGYGSLIELLGKSAFDLTPPEEHKRIMADIATTLKNGVVRNVEYTMLKKNGSRFFVEISAAVLKDADGQPSGIVGIVRDITERNQVEKDLRASEERFRQLAENIREVFWMTNRTKDEMIYVSPGFEEIWGQPCENLYALPGSWIEAIHPGDRERVLKAVLSKQVSGQYDEVYRIVRPDGSHRWIHDRAFPIRDDSGQVYRIAGIAEDITKRKQTEEALRESEARKNAIMQAAHDAIITIDHKGAIVEFNSAAERIFGYSRRRVIGRQFQAVLPPWSREWFQRGLARFFSGDEGPSLGSRIEIVALRAPGAEFLMEFTITHILLEDKPMFTIFVRDITERKRIEVELRSLPRRILETQELERLRIARELHDGVNQILASAKMRLQKIQEKDAGLSPATEEILVRCERLLVQALEENRRIAYNLRPSDLDNLGLTAACRNFCKDVQSRTNLVVKSSIMRLKQRLPSHLELHLFRIVQEAINNAEKHARARNIHVRIACQGDLIVLKIQDDGRGFAPRVPKGGKKKSCGMGITNMRERAAILGGTCEFESVPKQGTTITVRVPHPDKSSSDGRG